MAVKVRHPGVVKSIQRDFALMLQAAKLVALIPAIGKMRPEETLAQFAAPLQEQVPPPPGPALPPLLLQLHCCYCCPKPKFLSILPNRLVGNRHGECIVMLKPSTSAQHI